ncbi:hypothetical protein [Spirillospora sp. CA-294931]|uniref:hypothetical protein n=1 Tax=Spirillospora sp. CA-294931 TaxID=3240042 RepID=UPI003D8B5CB6
MKTRLLAYASGAVLIGIGLLGIVRDLDDPVGWAVWFAGVVVAHDAVLMPAVLAAGALTGRLPDAYRRGAQVALAMAAVVSLVALPLVLGKGRRADNPSQLPLSYGWNLLVVLAVIAAAFGLPALWRRNRQAAAVAVWALLVAGSFLVGDRLRRAGVATEDALPPLHAEGRLLTWQLLPAVLVAGAAVAALPVLSRRLPWTWTLLAAWATSALWAVSLAMSDGWDALAGPLNAPTEYPAGIAAVGDDPLAWTRTFTEKLGGYTTHVRGHPPLPTLLLWGLDAAGAHGTGWSAALIIAAGSSAVVAVALTVRTLAGEETARRVVPFLALAPFAVWIATSMDAFFMGVGAWAVALVAVGARRGSLTVAAGGGLLLGTLPYLSYGLLPLFAVPAVVLLLTRPRVRVLAAIGCGAVIVPLAFTLAGFWWLDGVEATHATYLISRGSAQRPYAYFAVANLAVLGLLVGPAVAHALPAALGDLRGGLKHLGTPAAAAALLAGAGLLGTLALDASGVTRGEVERIWLPYAAWVVVAAARHREPARGPLAAQAVTAVLVQALVLSPW